MENDGKLIHKGDIDIALGILDDLRRFRHLDGFRAVDTRVDHQFIDLRHDVQGLRIHAGNDLGDGLQPVDLVSGIDALRRIPDLEVDAAP